MDITKSAMEKIAHHPDDFWMMLEIKNYYLSASAAELARDAALCFAGGKAKLMEALLNFVLGSQ